MNRRDDEIATHDPWLRRLARHLAHSRARADDLVQETYITALRKAPPDAQLRPWLRAVMYKLAWGQRRSELRRAQREDGFSLTAPPLTIPDALLDHGVDRERLTAALGGLPEPFQSTIVQRFLQGRSCADIARRDNVPAGTVRWRQARGLELLRAELAPPRRQRVLWVIPLIGAGGRLIAGLWQAVIARAGGKTLWLWLAAVAAVVYAISGGSRAPGRSSAGDWVARDDPQAARGVRAATFGHATGAAAARDGSNAAEARAAGLDAAPTEIASRAHRAVSASSDDVETHRDDCQWDPAIGWRCPETASAGPGDAARCAAIQQQILVVDALARAAPAGRSFLAAASTANRALAQRLGCPAMPPSRLDGGARSTGAGGRPGCATTVGDDGARCTVCPGEQPVCAPADCASRTTGAPGTDCGDEPPVCHSQITDGLLCTRCDDQPGAPDCMAAQCGVDGTCLRCVDPTGRTATDCSVDYGQYYTASVGGPPNDAFSFGSCTFSWGVPSFAGTTCNFPGTNTCSLTTGAADWQCLSCSYRDGSGGGLCGDFSVEPPPDVFADRPGDLPAPGRCVTELGPDGPACTTCTNEDLSATRSCREPSVVRCELLTGDASGCSARCTLRDGSTILMCPSPGGPRARPDPDPPSSSVAEAGADPAR